MGEIVLDRNHGGTNPTGSIIDFSVSTNPFGPPAAVLDAYHRAADAVRFYPEPYAVSLCAAIADRLGVSAQNVVVGNGSTQLFYLIARVLRPLRPFVVVPTFSEIANSLIVSGASPRPISLRRERGFQFDFGDIVRALESGADAVFLGRPNSPTGSMLDLNVLSTIARRCGASGCWCVVDEAFIDFADDPASAVQLVGQFEHMIVVRSMTKLYAIPGLRLGYLVASEGVSRKLGRALEPWSVSAPAIEVGKMCLAQSDDWCDGVCAALRDERTFLTEQLAAIPGFAVFLSVANFLMFEATSRRTISLSLHVRGRGIAIRDLAELPGAGSGMYRIGIRSHADNVQLIAALRSFAERS